MAANLVSMPLTVRFSPTKNFDKGGRKGLQKQSVRVTSREGHVGSAHNCNSRNLGTMEMNLVPSKQSLVVYSSRGRETNWSSRRRAEMCLLSLCGILLLTCIVLAALFGMDLSKTGTDKYGLSTSPPTPTTRASEPRVCNTATCLETAARLTRNMNESVDPCEDFFHFACDGWIRDNPIPPSENEYITFIKKIQANNEKLRNMLEDAIGDYEDPIMKAKRYYRSCMDENEVERTTKDQVLELIRSLGSCALQGEDWAMSRWNWKTALLKIQKTFLHSSPLFTIDVSTNPRNSKKHIVMIKLPELSLIREEYLARNDSKVDKKKNAYLDYMTSVAMLIGGHNDAIQMHLHSVLEFEGKLAQSMPSTAYLYENLHNAITIDDLQQLAPQFQWLDYLNSLFAEYSISLKKSQKIIVPAPEYLKKMAEVVLSTNNSTLSDYFIWTVLRRLAPFLSRPFRDVEAKYKRIASHIKGESPRWLTCIKAVNYHRGLGFATGSLYVEKAFDEKMIPLVKEMMENIRTAFREEVANLEWIDDETRPKVYEKEEAIVEKIGYPEMCVNKTSLAGYYQDVSVKSGALEVDNKRFLLNEVNVSRWYSSKSLAKLGRPSLRGRWFNGPQSVNAYYKWEKNEINILAGILQPPFYYGRLAPRVVNFGAIGVVLAHELTHGFDSVGRKFNKYGEISKPWWSSYTLDGFQNRSECLVDQYNKYPLDIEGKRIFINGRQTLFENIADNGAVKIAHRAYKNWARKHGSDAMVPGMKRSNDQIFFLTYAQMWCSNFSPSQIFRRAKTDTHTLPIYRVNGVLSNMEEFAKAYNCPRDSKLNPKKRCRVW